MQIFLSLCSVSAKDSTSSFVEFGASERISVLIGADTLGYS